LVTTGSSADERRGRLLQRLTIAWNLAEVGITITLGVAAGSLALVAFGMDSLVEVFASLVVLWHMRAVVGEASRDERARRFVGMAFAVLASYLLIAGVRALWTGAEPDSSPLGIAYLALTVLVMFALAVTKRRVGERLASEPFLAEARMTFLDGCLAISILVALVLNSLFGWWWADAGAALVVAAAAAREARELLVDDDEPRPLA
jgi:divalent metal cation (Fe/Co/Zn/Cd) transporter